MQQTQSAVGDRREEGCTLKLNGQSMSQSVHALKGLDSVPLFNKLELALQLKATPAAGK